MPKKFAASILKNNNKKRITKYLYEQKRSTPFKIESALELSRPTVAQILKELTDENTIYIDGLAQSTGGRKANIYTFNPSQKVAIGLEIRHDRFELAVIDLFARMLKYETHIHPFAYEPAYFDYLAATVNQFISTMNSPKESLLGVGIGLQALISTDGKNIIYGKLLNCTGLSIEEFTSRIPYPCVFNHDAESLANIELWFNKELKDAIFFNVRDNLSGTVIINRSFFRGGELKSGVFEHLTLIPGGKPCYCGKKGCVNSYCSFSALLNPEEDIDSFFLALRSGDEAIQKRWDQYLSYLAQTIDNLHMILTCRTVLGGKLANYLTDEDINILHKKVHRQSAFPSEEEYIQIGRTTSLPLCVGAAIPLVNKYLHILF